MLHTSSLGELSVEERRRIRRRRQLSKKTPQQRQKIKQYHRRHNEKDGILYYCDYCDSFIHSSEKSWRKHLTGNKHIKNFEAYYNLVEDMERETWNALLESTAQASLDRQGSTEKISK